MALLVSYGYLPGTDITPSVGFMRELPNESLEFFTPGEWDEDLMLLDPDSDSTLAESIGFSGAREAEEVETNWNSAPLSPSPYGYEARRSQRIGDRIEISVGAFATAEADTAYIGVGRASSETPRCRGMAKCWGVHRRSAQAASPCLRTRAGTPLRSQPPARRRGRLIGTEVEVSWTFDSAPVEGDQPEVLPLAGVRFESEVDDFGRAPAGVEYPVQLHPEHLLGTEITELTMEVSYDDGASWAVVPTTATEQGATALLDHPDSDGFVSLRASAVDAAGNSVDQTMLRSYQITTG
ncbi:hypothetical protein [Actinoalloteichus hymeniacidonis]|uniref:Uncharacterized protein n=1 Tax=Actinoalloteichus hymeniacidonis TaxID=340345 RepID=A0AAC9N1C6_9PSEU|nr:hypothetical protein [Actinoalloteichus hymeniacidonis]AOS65746.1 hypothetical protein TL08_24840 [Actinoalloteichus hymeniacidonis]MBB5906164.1 hypothetical protein [Actinoalloteichus hymeniacidonis]